MIAFSKTEHAQKTHVQIANESQRTGAVRISTAKKITIVSDLDVSHTLVWGWWTVLKRNQFASNNTFLHANNYYPVSSLHLNSVLSVCPNMSEFHISTSTRHTWQNTGQTTHTTTLAIAKKNFHFPYLNL